MKKRKDGLYEYVLTKNGERKHFYGRSPQSVMRKVAAYRDDMNGGRVFGAVADEWIDEVDVSHATLVTYRRYCEYWTDCFGTSRLHEIKPRSIQNALKRYSVGHSFKTTSNCLSVLRLIFEFAIIKGYAEENPTEYITVPKGLPRKKRGFPTDGDIELVHEHRTDSYMSRIFFTALYTGLRRGELFALQWKDIDFDNEIVHVTKSVKWESNVPRIGRTKTDNGVRDTILLPEVAELLKPMQSLPDEYVFAVDGKIPHESYITRRVKEYQNETGVRLTLHEMRHGFATLCFEREVDAKSVQHLLGHAQSSTTLDIYTHWQNESLENVRKKFVNRS